jgi:hypothetical protein
MVLEPLLEGVALVPGLAITTAVTIPIMTWLAMPRVTRLFHRWLYPTDDGEPCLKPCSVEMANDPADQFNDLSGAGAVGV